MKSAFIAFIVCVVLWIISAIGIIIFQASNLNLWFINMLGKNSINISDGINLGVAIGTIGAVITSLYQINKLKKDKEKDRLLSMLSTSQSKINDINKIQAKQISTISDHLDFRVIINEYTLWLRNQISGHNYIDSEIEKLCQSLDTNTSILAAISATNTFHTNVLKFINKY